MVKNLVKDSSITDLAKIFNLRLNVGRGRGQCGQLTLVNGQWPMDIMDIRSRLF